MKHKVLVTRRWPAMVEAKLMTELADQFDTSLNSSDKQMNAAEYSDALRNFDAILTTVTDRLDHTVFASLPTESIRTRFIGNYGVGFSHIDIKAAGKSGITVSNTPDVLSECTADIAIMLMLMAARRAGEGEREVRAGQWTGWRPTHLIGNKVSGAALGIVGFGRIGRETARRALGFGMNIMVHNRSIVDPAVLADYNATQVDSLQTLMQSSDFVSLHCPGGDANKHLINADLLSQMKATAYLINTARGEVVDEKALLSCLQKNTIAGAGLDVFENEPLISPELLQCDNAVLLPHMGSSTHATRDAMGFRVLENLKQHFDGKDVTDRVCQ